MTTEDFHWAVGFLEGEGTFCPTKNGGTLISAAQANNSWEPIERLLALFGGHIHDKPPRPPSTAQKHWCLYGDSAVELMKQLKPFLSARRQRQIEAALSRRKYAHNRYKTKCPRGHPYDLLNTRRTRLKTGGYGRWCIRCSSNYYSIHKVRINARRRELRRLEAG